MKAKSAVDVIGLDAVRRLRDCGFVVVHQEPTESMLEAAVANKWPEQRCPREEWHRMVADSIRQQNKASPPEIEPV